MIEPLALEKAPSTESQPPASKLPAERPWWGDASRLACLVWAAEQAQDFRRLVDLAPEAIFVHREGRVLYANTAGHRIFNAPLHRDLFGVSLSELFHPQAREAVGHALLQGGDDPAPRVQQLERALLADGRCLDLELSSAAVSWQGKPACCAIVRDISNRRRAEQALAASNRELGERVQELRSSEEKFSKLFRASPAAMTLSTLDSGRILEVNESFLRLVRRPRHEVIGARVDEIGFFAGRYRREMVRQIRRHRRIEGMEVEIGSPAGEPRHFLHYAEVVRIGARDCVLSLGHDVTEQKAFEARLRRLAFLDPLTELPNRAWFENLLDDALSRVGRQTAGVAVLYLDLNRFKVVNDALGHAAGDRLLRDVARRLAGCGGGREAVARLGGDEFGLLIEDVAGPEGAVAAAEGVIAALAAPMEIDQTPIYAQASIGIACGNGSECPRDLLRFADVAMYRAKREGSPYHLFDLAVDTVAADCLHLENELRQAVARRELVLHYQPIVSLPDGALVGAEALVRWNHPRRGLLLPAAFIPLAEESGLIDLLGHWALEEACRQGREWTAGLAPEEPFTLSVNLSARQLHDMRLVERLGEILAATAMPPERLLLELTENVLVGAPERAWGLCELGVRLAIDDFGTGYASLAYLKRLPVATLKVDQSFTRGLGHDPADATLVRTILFMARNLGLEVVAEGIETEAQRDYLQRIGCPFAQGYHFGRPMPPADLAARFRLGPGGARRATA